MIFAISTLQALEPIVLVSPVDFLKQEVELAPDGLIRLDDGVESLEMGSEPHKLFVDGDFVGKESAFRDQPAFIHRDVAEQLLDAGFQLRVLVFYISFG